jgi:hypothetical protein
LQAGMLRITKVFAKHFHAPVISLPRRHGGVTVAG